MSDWFYNDLEVVKEVRSPKEVNIPLLGVENESKIKPGRGRKKLADDSNDTADSVLFSNVDTQNVAVSVGDLSDGQINQAQSLQDTAEIQDGIIQSASSLSTHAACKLAELDAEVVTPFVSQFVTSPGDGQVQDCDNQSGLDVIRGLKDDDLTPLSQFGGPILGNGGVPQASSVPAIHAEAQFGSMADFDSFTAKMKGRLNFSTSLLPARQFGFQRHTLSTPSSAPAIGIPSSPSCPTPFDNDFTITATGVDRAGTHTTNGISLSRHAMSWSSTGTFSTGAKYHSGCEAESCTAGQCGQQSLHTPLCGFVTKSSEGSRGSWKSTNSSSDVDYMDFDDDDGYISESEICPVGFDDDNEEDNGRDDESDIGDDLDLDCGPDFDISTGVRHYAQ
jgi:hypothetical protein